MKIEQLIEQLRFVAETGEASPGFTAAAAEARLASLVKSLPGYDAARVAQIARRFTALVDEGEYKATEKDFERFLKRDTSVMRQLADRSKGPRKGWMERPGQQAGSGKAHAHWRAKHEALEGAVQRLRESLAGIPLPAGGPPKGGKVWLDPAKSAGKYVCQIGKNCGKPATHELGYSSAYGNVKKLSCKQHGEDGLKLLVSKGWSGPSAEGRQEKGPLDPHSSKALFKEADRIQDLAREAYQRGDVEKYKELRAQQDELIQQGTRAQKREKEARKNNKEREALAAAVMKLAKEGSASTRGVPGVLSRRLLESAKALKDKELLARINKARQKLAALKKADPAAWDAEPGLESALKNLRLAAVQLKE